MFHALIKGRRRVSCINKQIKLFSYGAKDGAVDQLLVCFFTCFYFLLVSEYLPTEPRMARWIMTGRSCVKNKKHLMIIKLSNLNSSNSNNSTNNNSNNIMTILIVINNSTNSNNFIA